MPKRDGLRSELKNGMRVKKSVPGWQDRLEDDIDNVRKETFRDKFVRPRFQLGLTLNRMLNEAAYDRGISRSAYVRRAVAAVIAYDLNSTIEEVLVDSPKVAGYGVTSPGPKSEHAQKADDAQGYGPWRIPRMDY